MNRHPSNAELLEELEGRQNALNHLEYTNGPKSYINFYKREINGLKKEISRRMNENKAASKQVTRRMANSARKQAVAKRQMRVARKVTNIWRARTMRPPNLGGLTYQRLLRQTRVGRTPPRSLSPKRIRKK